MKNNNLLLEFSLYLWQMLPKKLHNKLEERKANHAFRQLGQNNDLVDFSSNDYLGFSKSEAIFNSSHQYLLDSGVITNGATGSRLLSGNHQLYTQVEQELSHMHKSDGVLICNSGYDANIGLLSSVAQRGDVILYDELIHASLRDGIQMSHAKSYKFKHNNLQDLDNQCEIHRNKISEDASIYIVTESVFSMDGDSPDLQALSEFSSRTNTYLIIDEAHAVGVFNLGLVQNLGLEKAVFARIITFGKALGCHGAAILGSADLKDYLINFSRSFIYTTALPPHSLATISTAYKALNHSEAREQLQANIEHFKNEIRKNGLSEMFIQSASAIHCGIISGNKQVKQISKHLQSKGFDVKPILSPTVPKGKERLRFCLHSYNSKAEISEVLRLLATFVNQA